jgi:hypothetical protein
MYCPKCGTQNVDNASFCRGCGANVSLIPQALNGHLPEAVVAGDDGRAGQHREEDEANLSKAIVKVFVGIAFVLVALSVKNVSADCRSVMVVLDAHSGSRIARHRSRGVHPAESATEAARARHHAYVPPCYTLMLCAAANSRRVTAPIHTRPQASPNRRQNCSIKIVE